MYMAEHIRKHQGLMVSFWISCFIEKPVHCLAIQFSFRDGRFNVILRKSQRGF